MSRRAKAEDRKDAASPDIGNIGVSEDTASRRLAAVESHGILETEHSVSSRRPLETTTRAGRITRSPSVYPRCQTSEIAPSG